MIRNCGKICIFVNNHRKRVMLSQRIEEEIEFRVCPLPFSSKSIGFQFAIQDYEDQNRGLQTADHNVCSHI